MVVETEEGGSASQDVSIDVAKEMWLRTLGHYPSERAIEIWIANKKEAKPKDWGKFEQFMEVASLAYERGKADQSEIDGKAKTYVIVRNIEEKERRRIAGVLRRYAETYEEGSWKRTTLTVLAGKMEKGVLK